MADDNSAVTDASEAVDQLNYDIGALMIKDEYVDFTPSVPMLTEYLIVSKRLLPSLPLSLTHH